MKSQNTSETVVVERRYDIDWLRVFAVLLLLPFHCIRIFDIRDPWYVKNDQLSGTLTYFLYYIHPWHMALFFGLAGASTWFAFRKRTSAEYLKERLLRLLVPFLFGMIVIVPPQVFYDLVQHASFNQPFFHVYRYQFLLNPKELGTYASQFDPGHLWFIAFLFLFSIISLPLFRYFNLKNGKRMMSALASLISIRGMIFLMAIPLLIADRLLGHHNVLWYLIFFIYGYVLLTDKRFNDAIDKHKLAALILGPVLYLIVPYFNVSGWPNNIPQWLSHIITFYLEGFIPWIFVIALLGYGKQFLGFTNKMLKYMVEASYPLYIIHQTIIVVLGFYIVKLNTGVLLKFLLVLLSALICTIVLYDLIVKRISVIRFLFGMRLKKRI